MPEDRETHDITGLLDRWRLGDAEAACERIRNVLRALDRALDGAGDANLINMHRFQQYP